MQYKDPKTNRFVSKAKAEQMILDGASVAFVNSSVKRDSKGRVATVSHRPKPDAAMADLVRDIEDTITVQGGQRLMLEEDVMRDPVGIRDGLDVVMPSQIADDEAVMLGGGGEMDVTTSPAPAQDGSIVVSIGEIDVVMRPAATIEYNHRGAVRSLDVNGVEFHDEGFTIGGFNKVSDNLEIDEVLTMTIEDRNETGFSMPWEKYRAPSYDAEAPGTGPDGRGGFDPVDVAFLSSIPGSFHDSVIWSEIDADGNVTQFSSSDPIEIALLGGNPEGVRFDEHGRIVSIDANVIQDSVDGKSNLSRFDSFNGEIDAGSIEYPGMHPLVYLLMLMSGLALLAFVIHFTIGSVL